MLNKIFPAVCAAAATALFSFNTAFASPTIIKFAGQSSADHPATAFMNDIASQVKEKTDGRVELKVYPANQLGNYSTVYQEQIQGTIGLSCISLPSDFDPRMELVYINGYVSSYADAKRLFAPDQWMFKKLSEFNERLGVKLLGFFIEGFIGTGTTKEVAEPLNPNVSKGVVVRIPNMNVYKFGAEAMGYKTMSIPYPEVYQAIQTKVVDGVDGYPVAAAYTALSDAINYWYNTKYSIEFLGCMVSEKIWSTITPGDQKIIQDIFTDATMASIDNAESIDAHYMDLMRKKGIKVYDYTKEELAPMTAAIVKTWPKLKKTMDPELIDEFVKEMAPKK